MHARSPDGRWTFDDGHIRSDDRVAGEALETDFHERWTFARFLAPDVLAAAWETSQPWGDGGSYGYPLWGLQVLALRGGAWEVVAFEYDVRARSERFVPRDVAWHPRGVLAWVQDEGLEAIVLPRPRVPLRGGFHLPLPSRDGEEPGARCLHADGRWTSLAISPDGGLVTARDDDGRYTRLP